MSLFKVNLVAINPADRKKRTPPIEVLVDTGAELSWLPEELLEKAGIKRLRKRVFLTATKQTIERDVGYAILQSEGFETIDEVVFADKNDMHLLGVRTIEGFGVSVDSVGHRFVAVSTLAVTLIKHKGTEALAKITILSEPRNS